MYLMPFFRPKSIKVYKHILVSTLARQLVPDTQRSMTDPATHVSLNNLFLVIPQQMDR